MPRQALLPRSRLQTTPSEDWNSQLFDHINEEISYDPSQKDLVWMKYIPIWSTYTSDKTSKKEMDFIVQTFIDNLGAKETLKTVVISEDMPLDDKIFMASYMIKKAFITKGDLENTIVEVIGEYQTISGISELTLETLSVLPQRTLDWLMDLDVLYELSI